MKFGIIEAPSQEALFTLGKLEDQQITILKARWETKLRSVLDVPYRLPNLKTEIKEES